MAKVKVGLVGCGFVAELHMYAYKRVYGLEVEVSAVAARGAQVIDFAKKHQIATTYRDFRDLIANRDLDVIDICTPPMLHTAMIVDAMQAGKHVICEKPFAGYFQHRVILCARFHILHRADVRTATGNIRTMSIKRMVMLVGLAMFIAVPALSRRIFCTC